MRGKRRNNLCNVTSCTPYKLLVYKKSLGYSKKDRVGYSLVILSTSTYVPLTKHNFIKYILRITTENTDRLINVETQIVYDSFK